jgi:hypothetical protein
MQDSPGIPWLEDDGFRTVAAEFLKRYNAWDDIPVDIDNIVDVRMHINIIPVPGLQKVVHNAMAFISSDLKSITVDDYVFMHQEQIYRFCLAHEIAHLLIHSKLLETHSITTIDDYRAYQAQFDARTYARMEWQADQLAGLILVPSHLLKREFARMRGQASREGLDLRNLGGSGFAYVTALLAEQFNVSRAVMEIRLRNDGLVRGSRR